MGGRAGVIGGWGFRPGFFTLTPAQRDLLSAGVAIMVLWTAMTAMDLFEHFYHFSREHEEYELDELVPMIFFVALGALWYGFRRTREGEALNRELLNALDELQARGEALDRHKRNLEELNGKLEERVAREVVRREQQQQILIQQSKMAAMGEMIGAIAHQWRQPLSSLRLIIQDLEDAMEHDEADRAYIRETVDHSMQQIQFMSTTIDDFRDFFKPSRQKRAFCLAKTVEGVSFFFSSQLKSNNIRILFDPPEEPVELVGFENEFTQVLLNLVGNAKDALLERMEEGVLPKGDGWIRIGVGREGDRVTLLVKDNGGGIPEQVLPRVFEPYFTTKKPGKGTGVGLYMSRMIVEQNFAGTIAAVNREGGAEFRLEVPAGAHAPSRERERVEAI